ncbi:MAG: hypothetical protein FJ297_08540 [Planctomycetes bacterium]|nr:hypothetical protein [Planctomycetota bacterium]
MTMLEMVIATTMLTAVLTTVSVVMRTGRGAWEAHESDFTRLEAAHATVRHIVRSARQAESIVAVTSQGNPAGSLSVQMPDGQTLVWSRNGADNSVLFGAGAADQLLADGITQLTFQGYRADGLTATNTVSQIQCLLVTASVNLARDGSPSRTVRSWVTIRTW